MSQKLGFTTEVLHSDRLDRPEHGAIHKPIHTSLAYGHAKAEDLAEIFQGKKKGYSYSRMSNPTVTALEKKIVAMENGSNAVVFSTGMAAISSTLLSILRSGDHVIASKFLFGNTRGVFGKLQELGIDVSYVDSTNCENIKLEIGEHTKLVFVETIANPGTQIADLAGIGEVCREASVLFVVDNTIATPCLFKPKDVGAGLIFHSLSKYICGHGNALGGVVIDTGFFDWRECESIYDIYKKDFPEDEWICAQIRAKGLRDFGGSLAPESAHHISVGSETLALRMNKNCANAYAIHEVLIAHPVVRHVNYPGSSCHPQHNRAGLIFDGRYGALLSFELKDGFDCMQFINQLKVAIISVNIGDNRTLVVPIAETIFYEMGVDGRREMGIEDSLIRVSVGIEDSEDIVNDFRNALDSLLERKVGSSSFKSMESL